MKETLLLDQNSLENLKENQKKIVESLLLDKDQLKLLGKKSSEKNTNILQESECKNSNESNNLLRNESDITKDKIENFRENISHIFNSYNNEFEVPKLKDDKLSESNKTIKENLEENSDCEPYELCNTLSSKENNGEVSKLCSNKRNKNFMENLNKNYVNMNNENQRNSNDDTIYCLRESLEDKSNKCNNEKKSISRDSNFKDRHSKTFYKENKTEYFKSKFLKLSTYLLQHNF